MSLLVELEFERIFNYETRIAKIQYIYYCNSLGEMQERVNKHKPLPKKDVQESVNFAQQVGFRENSKLSSNSQNKVFIRKPVSRRNGCVSPAFVKNQQIQNEELSIPYIQLKSKMSVPVESRSDQDYWERQEKGYISNKITIKRRTPNHQDTKPQQRLFGNTQAIKQAYFGNDMHALTQVGQSYKVQTVQSDNSQKEEYFCQNMKKNYKQNLAIDHINSHSKKITRTQYFTNTIEETRSSTSRSLKQKQVNFSQLKFAVNNNIEAYVCILEGNIRKIEKTNQTLSKKCKWMHEQVQMHLEKEHLLEAQNKGLNNQIKTRQTKIQFLTQQIESLKKQLIDPKIILPNKQSPIRYKSFKDLQTISSLKQLSAKKQQNFLVRDNAEEAFHGYFGNSSASIQKNKKLSFKTYPGVISSKKSKQDLSKCSSIVGNESYQDLGQTSILNDRSNQRRYLELERSSIMCEDLRKEKDILKTQVDSMKQDMNRIKQSSRLQIHAQKQQCAVNIMTMQKQIETMRSNLKKLEQQNKNLSIQLNRILIVHQQDVKILNFRIQQIQNIALIDPTSCKQARDFKDLQTINPLQYLSALSNDNGKQVHHFENENKSLRIYIENVLQHYKYIKIQNRMLLKVKEDLQKSENEKKQIKEQRDMFKKKLLEIIKNNNSPKANKANNGLTDSESDESEEEISAVLELSQSEIVCQQSEVIPNQDEGSSQIGFLRLIQKNVLIKSNKQQENKVIKLV